MYTERKFSPTEEEDPIETGIELESQNKNPGTVEVKDGKPETKSNRFRHNLKRLLLLGMVGLGDHTSANKPELTAEQRLNKAKWEMETKGITSEQAQAYKPGVSEIIYRTVKPYGYNPTKKELWKDLKENIAQPELRFEMHHLPREDAWRLYLGLRQINETFAISDYQPAQSKEDKYYYKMPDFWGHYIHFLTVLLRNKGEGSRVEDAIKTLASIAEIKDPLETEMTVGFEARRDDVIYGMGVMGRFKFSLGKDEKGTYISYYDKWDLHVAPENGKGFFGKPFEIYDRFYFDPATFKPTEPLTLVEKDFGNQQTSYFPAKLDEK